MDIILKGIGIWKLDKECILFPDKHERFCIILYIIEKDRCSYFQRGESYGKGLEDSPFSVLEDGKFLTTLKINDWEAEFHVISFHYILQCPQMVVHMVISV